MSRKDFILIAQTILDIPAINAIRREEIAKHFANMLSDTNDQFKRDLFIQAATGIVPVTARNARV